jgi:hypothetical protein
MPTCFSRVLSSPRPAQGSYGAPVSLALTCMLHIDRAAAYRLCLVDIALLLAITADYTLPGETTNVGDGTVKCDGTGQDSGGACLF